MYSVLIQTQKTIEEFAKFQPLFSEAISNNKIGICKWIENGTTIDTALPELANMVNDKEEWCAIIVRCEDESKSMGFENDPQNPYDFVYNHTEQAISESPIPIIRLTQMLGGIPSPELNFKSEIVFENNKTPKTIYKPIYNDEDIENYELLSEKYRFDGKLPSSIIIITVRKNYIQNENIGKAWLYHKESESSEFWKINRYPSNCRFLVCDFLDGGPIKKDCDEFNFWVSVLMMAINETDSSTLQAYRLYNLKSDFDKEQMTDVFQHLVNKLKSSRYTIEENLKNEAKEKLDIEPELPRYRMDVPVSIKVPKDTDALVKTNTFGLFGSGALTDIGVWNSKKKNSEKMLEKSVLSAERTLDKTAEHIKEFLNFEEHEVSGLDKYQVEDLTNETDEIYGDIVRMQGMLPKSKLSNDEQINEAADNVKKYLLGRVTGGPGIRTIIYAILLFIMSMTTSMLVANDGYHVDMKTLGIIIGVGTVAILVFSLGMIIFQKRKLNILLDKYNRRVKNAFNQLTNNATSYSRYLTDIVSHSRGCSYLKLSERRKNYAESKQIIKYKHIKAINIFLEKIRCWSKAYYLNVDFNSNFIEDNTYVDFNIAPADSKLYTIETGTVYQVEVNNSGFYIDSPFSFVKKLKIVREEIYDECTN